LSALNAFAELKPKNYPDKLEEFFKESPFYPDRVDDVAIELIKGMLTMCPQRRLTIEECLEHPYFTIDPLPSDKSDLPLLEDEAHEHALREEKKEIRRAKADKEANQGALKYPTSQNCSLRKQQTSNLSRENKGNSTSSKASMNQYSGTKRQRED